MGLTLEQIVAELNRLEQAYNYASQTNNYFDMGRIGREMVDYQREYLRLTEKR
jgi:hypothetical protein